jgi:hypothetical protein
MNTWDRAVVTTGFLQWTTGEGGDGTLANLLQSILDAHPTVFRDRLGAYGIDLDHGKLAVTLADGTVLRGGPAARHVQTNPKLVAVLSAASMAPEVQVLQIVAAARDKIDKMRSTRVTVKGQAVRVGDVVSSTRAVGILTDVAVHGGEGRAPERVAVGLARFLEHEPHADLTDAATRIRAEPFVVSALTIDPSRARDFDPLNHDSGSFVP